LTSQINDLIEELTSGDEQIAENAAMDIASLGEISIMPLAALLKSTNPDIRWWAVRTLAEISHPDVPVYLVSALQDPDPSVQQCAALALRQNPRNEAIPVLISLLTSTDRLTARLAADALITTGEHAVLFLIDVLQNGDQATRIEAARALAMIGDTRSIPYLFSLINEDSMILEYWANEGLDRMGVGMIFVQPFD
jgi:HEAT repeat protein